MLKALVTQDIPIQDIPTRVAFLKKKKERVLNNWQWCTVSPGGICERVHPFPDKNSNINSNSVTNNKVKYMFSF